MKNVVSLLQTGYITVGVQFGEGGKVYNYKAEDSLGLVVGDTVVTKSGLAGVVRVDDCGDIDIEADYEYTWITDRIDRTLYEARLSEEALLKRKIAVLAREALLRALVGGDS